MSRRKKPQRTHRPRKRLNLGVDTLTAYLVQFEIRTPEGMSPPWMRKESPPTLVESEARGAYEQLLREDEQHDLGIRNPQLVERVVTDTVIAARDQQVDEPGPDADQHELEPAEAQ